MRTVVRWRSSISIVARGGVSLHVDVGMSVRVEGLKVEGRVERGLQRVVQGGPKWRVAIHHLHAVVSIHHVMHDVIHVHVHIYVVSTMILQLVM